MRDAILPKPRELRGDDEHLFPVYTLGCELVQEEYVHTQNAAFFYCVLYSGYLSVLHTYSYAGSDRHGAVLFYGQMAFYQGGRAGPDRRKYDRSDMALSQ